MLPRPSKRAFTLIEMAMVLLLTGLVAGIALKFTASSGTAECYTTTKAQLNSVKDAIERFALKNDRFPMPARRNVGVESPVYGREVPPANIAEIDKVTNGDGTVAVFGALPFQALGVPVENAMDCWGNKLTYVVTLDLTDTTKFLVPATDGALDIKTDNSAALFLKGAGYAIISHGEDQLGAVKNNYDSGAVNDAASRKWCSSTAELRTQDCDVTNNELVDGVFNNGKDAAAAYFDDLIVYRGKPWRVGAAACSAQQITWGACSANIAAMNDGAITTGITSTNGTNGTVDVKCSAGSLVQSNEDCDGGWSDWTSCQNDCTTSRTCTNPPPIGGGTCIGPDTGTCTPQSLQLSCGGFNQFWQPTCRNGTTVSDVQSSTSTSGPCLYRNVTWRCSYPSYPSCQQMGCSDRYLLNHC